MASNALISAVQEDLSRPSNFMSCEATFVNSESATTKPADVAKSEMHPPSVAVRIGLRLPCWIVASRKASVVRGVQSGLISRDDALERWHLSGDELDEWLGAVNTHGEAALKVTLVQKYRQP